MHIRPAAVGALDFDFFEVGDVVLPGEFLIAIFTMKGVSRHNVSPRQHDSAELRGRL